MRTTDFRRKTSATPQHHWPFSSGAAVAARADTRTDDSCARNPKVSAGEGGCVLSWSTPSWSHARAWERGTAELPANLKGLDVVERAAGRPVLLTGSFRGRRHIFCIWVYVLCGRGQHLAALCVCDKRSSLEMAAQLLWQALSVCFCDRGSILLVSKEAGCC